MATITYRQGNPLDISNIYRLLDAEEKLIEIPWPMMHPNKMVAYIAAMLNDGVVVVADLDGRLKGVAMGQPIKPPWSDLWVLDMPFLVVDSHFRKHGVAQNLIKTVLNWAADKKLPVWIEALTGGKSAVIKDRFIAMQGLTYMGGRFLHWPKDLPAKG
jgi:GNAT superfamily N-acetyltransferase